MESSKSGVAGGRFRFYILILGFRKTCAYNRSMNNASPTPACYSHNWYLLKVELPPSMASHWRCLKCDVITLTRGNRPRNFPDVPACEQLTSNLDDLIRLESCLGFTERYIAMGDVIATSVWRLLQNESQVTQNLEDLPETQILQIIDRLVTAKCDVTRRTRVNSDILIVRRPNTYSEAPPWKKET